MPSPPANLSRSGPLEIAARLDRLPLSRIHWQIVVLCGLATFFDVYEIYMSGILGSVLDKQWHLTSFTKPLLIGAPYFGMILGAIVLGFAADRFGRRPMFMFNLGAYSLLALASAFSVNVEMLITLRVLTGVFLAAELILVDTYLSEYLPKRNRGRMIAVAYAIGFLAAPVVAGAGGLLIVKTDFLIPGWRWLLILGALGAFIIYWLRRKLPESARWLAEKNRPEEADVLVRKFEETVEQQTGKQLPDVAAVVYRPVKKIPFAAMFRPPYAKRTLMLWIFQITQTVGQYGFASLATVVLVSKGYSIPQSLLYTALTFVGAPVGALLAIPLVERIERKYLITFGLALIGVAGIIFGTSTTDVVIVLAGVVITITNSVVSSAWHIYQAELFPTQVRSTAGGVAYSLSRLTAGLLPFAALSILAAFGPTWVFVAAAAVIAITCLDVMILGPKTNGRMLEVVTGTGQQSELPRGVAA